MQLKRHATEYSENTEKRKSCGSPGCRFAADWAPRKAQRSFALRYLRPLLLVIAIGRLESIAQDKASRPEQLRSEIAYRDGTFILISDLQERLTKTRYHAKGNVQILFQDIVITGEEAEYDTETREGFTTGPTHFSQNQQWLTCSKSEFNLSTQTGKFYDASGFTDREFFLTGRTIYKTGRDTYRVDNGVVTTCPEPRPKWSFSAARTSVKVDRTARLHNPVFKIKGVPIFYSPYLIIPMEKKSRSSGLVPFHTGTSSSKGRFFSEGYYQTLGKSADMTIYGDYFTERGLALGGLFRIRPSSTTRFDLDAYGINDKLDQSGVRLIVDGEARLKDNWRAIAKVNITSSFSFRQAFADSFRSATVSQERATAFMTHNSGSFSTNIAFQREEVVFPVRNLVIRKLPSLEFLSLGTPLGRSPLSFELRASMDAMSRADSSMETQGPIQRLDLYPRLALRLPSVKGFSLAPSIGIRETYYGARISADSPYGVVNQGLHRRYADVSVDMRTPVLQRDFNSSWSGKFRHTVEPFITYRWIHGIDELDKTIRFDEADAIADTNELEYGIMNRFFRERQTGAGIKGMYEFMAIGLVQKYYFDPSFGGAFKPDSINAFRPLDTVTGFYQTGLMHAMAPISAFFQFNPRGGIHHDLRADYDIKLQRWRNTSFTSIWQQGKFIAQGTYFLTLPVEPGLSASNQLQGQIGYGLPTRGFSASMTVSYNFQTAQLLNSQSRFGYNWNCCGIATELTQYDLGLRTETRFSFSFTLKGIGSFGNLRRPESLF
jgi:LPS-assembly protein